MGKDQTQPAAFLLYRQDVDRAIGLGAAAAEAFTRHFDVMAREGGWREPGGAVPDLSAGSDWERVAGMLAEAFRLLRPSMPDWWALAEFFSVVTGVCIRVREDIAAMDSDAVSAFLTAGRDERRVPSHAQAVEIELTEIVRDFIHLLLPSPFGLATGNIRALRHEGGGCSLWMDRMGRHTLPYLPSELSRTG